MSITLSQFTLRFFDLDINIQSDSGSFLNGLAQLYRRFRLSDSAVGPVQRPVKLVVLTTSNNGWGRPVLLLDGEVWPVLDPKLLAGYTLQLLVNTFSTRIRSHYLIHAGAMVAGNQGLILAGNSFFGKTTLVLALVRNGFKLLSDETAALGRDDKKIHPYPRSLRIRPGSLERAGYPEVVADAPVWLGKYLLDIEQIQSNSLGQAAPINYVFILHDPARTQEMSSNAADYSLLVLVDRANQTFLEAVEGLDGVLQLESDFEQGYPRLRLQVTSRPLVSSQLEALCKVHQILMLDARHGSLRWPDFSRPPCLEAIPTSQAAMDLFGGFQGGYDSVIMEELGGSSAQLFMNLASIIGSAHCYRLHVGTLSDMVELVQLGVSN